MRGGAAWSQCGGFGSDPIGDLADRARTDADCAWERKPLCAGKYGSSPVGAVDEE